jgi:hypothetical protein
MHEAVQYIFNQRSEGVLNGSGAVLVVVGGLQRGYSPPENGQMWSHTVEDLLRKTGQVRVSVLYSSLFFPMQYSGFLLHGFIGTVIFVF